MAKTEDVWMYNPSFALAITATVIYGLIFLVISYLTLVKYRTKYFIVVVVGAAVEVAGYILRVYSIKHRSQIAPFALTLTFVVLAPIFIAAGNYLLISRLILAVLPASHHRIMKIPGRKLTRIFVCFDVIAFLIQGNASGIQSSNNWMGKTELIGRYIMIGGLIFQLVAFGLFLCVFRKFDILAKRLAVDDAPKGWEHVVRAVYISSALIMIRCIYRVCEYGEGTNGYAFRTEWLFWVFEALPMVGAIGVFCIYHPGSYLGRDGGRKSDTELDEAVELGRGSRAGDDAVRA